MMIIMMAMIMMIMIMIMVTKVKDDCGEDLFHPGDIVRMLVGESGRASCTKTFLSRNLFSQKIVNLFLTPVGALKILVGWSLTHADFLLGRVVGRGKRSDPFIAHI